MVKAGILYVTLVLGLAIGISVAIAQTRTIYHVVNSNNGTSIVSNTTFQGKSGAMLSALRAWAMSRKAGNLNAWSCTGGSSSSTCRQNGGSRVLWMGNCTYLGNTQEHVCDFGEGGQEGNVAFKADGASRTFTAEYAFFYGASATYTNVGDHRNWFILTEP